MREALIPAGGLWYLVMAVTSADAGKIVDF